jgi:hypothetical protein
MSKATDTEDLFKPATFRSVPEGKKGRHVKDTPEAKHLREEKLAQRGAERRERSEEIFARKRWTREEAIHWVAFRDKHSLEKSIRGAVFYDPNSLQDPNAESSFIEAVSDKRVTEYPDRRGLWYRSEQVTAVFPALGQCRTTEDAASKSRQPRSRAPSLVDRLAGELKVMYPSGRPAMKNKQIGRVLEERLSVGSFGDTTLKGALRRAFK